jgi:hypothetical protein
MSKTKISDYSSTPADNTDIGGINIAEGMLPSDVNNAIREQMAQLKNFQSGTSGESVTFATVNATTISASNINKVTVTAPATGATLTIADGKTLTANNSLTLAGTDATTMTFPSTSATIARTDAAQTFTGTQTFSSALVLPAGTVSAPSFAPTGDTNTGIFFPAADTIAFAEGGAEAMRIDSAGNVGIGTSSPVDAVEIARGSGVAANTLFRGNNQSYEQGFIVGQGTTGNAFVFQKANTEIRFGTNNTERMRIDSSGNLLVGKTTLSDTTSGVSLRQQSIFALEITAGAQSQLAMFNRQANDGDFIVFRQANVQEGSISVSGNTVSYNAFSGGHWSQLQQGRGYNPDIPRGTVMSTIGEMCLWKSVEWTETTEHPAIPAVEAKEAVLDEEGNVIEPAVEAVEGKDAWTETFNKRESYLGDLPVGATFEEDGFTKTVVDDGNERLPKVKVSDVVGDKAVYGVFQTWDEVQDMLVTSLGAFVVRIAAGVTVEIGDLLESNGDGCAKVQDDDVIRSKTIAKVTSTTPTATYDDGSYTVPAVIYCG